MSPWKKAPKIAPYKKGPSNGLNLYSDCLRQEGNFLASTRRVTCLVRVCLLHCMCVRLRNGYTQAYAQIMQHTHTHKAVTGRVEAKKLLSRWRQLIKLYQYQFRLQAVDVVRINKVCNFASSCHAYDMFCLWVNWFSHFLLCSGTGLS